MNKRTVALYVLGVSVFFGNPHETSAQNKGISFQTIMKKADGTYPTASGVTITAQILDPISQCVLREEEHTGKNISNGYLNLVLGESGVATPAARNPSPVLSISQVLDNKTIRTNLKCVDQANNIVGTGQSYVPSNVDRRVLRIRLNLQGEDIAADFNMRAVGFAVNSEMLNSKSDEDFVNINNAKGVTKANIESIFERFVKLDTILNNFDSGNTLADINISGNATTATTATNVSGTIGIANGGTGGTTAAAARANLELGPLATMNPSGAAGSTTYLRGDGTWQTLSLGSLVNTVAGRSGDVMLSHSDISGLGPLATKTTSGTANNTTYLRGDGTWTALGGAASSNIGTTAGTVAAGNDIRIMGAIQNAGTDSSSNIVSISAGADNDKPSSPVAGQMYVATDLQKIYRYNGISWVTVAEVGFDGSLAGDVSGPPSATTVNKIKGQNITSAATTAGQMLRYAGSGNWTPGFVAITDLRSTVTGVNAFASSCAAHQTLVYNSVGDLMTCQNISIPKAQVSDFPTLATVATSGSYNDLANKPAIPAAQVNSDWNAVSGVSQIINKPTLGALAVKSTVSLSSDVTGVLPIANGGTGTSNGSIVGTGAVTVTAGGSNTNINLVPQGTGTVDVASRRISSVATPTSSTDAATKAYVDAAAGSGGGMPTMISSETTGAYSLANANIYCDGLNTANSGAGTACEKKKGNTACDGTLYNTGWRLPSVEEVGFFLGYSSSTNYILTRSAFFNTESSFLVIRVKDGYWTSVLSYMPMSVRCVR